MKRILFFLMVGLAACQQKQPDVVSAVIAAGQMPNAVTDGSGNLHLVYGNGDSILYRYSSDKGKTFSSSSLVAVVPDLAASHMRGPQIAAVSNGLVVTACTSAGNIFSFVQEQGQWMQTGKVNDTDTTAKENLVALAADGNNAFAVWLDLRDKHNKIFGARSADGGKTWTRNIEVYASPDTTVCECCKPSVAINGNNVYVMFRNWLHGNRDLYLISSTDGGNTFGPAMKLGVGSWALNGCPMDGGALVIDNNGKAETVWNRKGIIYSCTPGEKEVELGKGKSCTMEVVNGKKVYAWVEDGDVVVQSEGREMILGKGQLPVLKTVGEGVVCVWEEKKLIYSAIVAI